MTKIAEEALSVNDGNHKTADEEKSSLQYQWITNEGLLRDEGTLYGIANADITDKLNAIVDYYDIQRADSRQKKDSLIKRRTEHEIILQSIPSELEQLKEKLTITFAEYPPGNLLPVTFQLIAYLSICIFNYYLIEYWLSPVITSKLICLGFYTFGLFSVFIGRSILYNRTNSLSEGKEEPTNIPREKWKIYLEEFGIPAIVALFICTLTFRSYPLEYSIVAFLFLFLLFLFSGKGLINTLFRLKKEFTNSWASLKSLFKFRKERKALNMKFKETENAIMETDKELERPEAFLMEQDAEQAYKTHIFLSEYRLAQQGQESLRPSQLSQFA